MAAVWPTSSAAKNDSTVMVWVAAAVAMMPSAITNATVSTTTSRQNCISPMNTRRTSSSNWNATSAPANSSACTGVSTVAPIARAATTPVTAAEQQRPGLQRTTD